MPAGAALLTNRVTHGNTRPNGPACPNRNGSGPSPAAGTSLELHSWRIRGPGTATRVRIPGPDPASASPGLSLSCGGTSLRSLSARSLTAPAHDPIRPRRARLVAAWLVGTYLAQLFVRTGWGQFSGDVFWTEAFATWGFPTWFRVLVGVVELAGGVALIIPWLASYGGVALCLVMMGAWSTLAHDLRWREMAVVALYGTAAGWIAYEWWWLRLRRRPPSDTG